MAISTYPYDPSAVTLTWSGGDASAGRASIALLGSSVSIGYDARIHPVADLFTSKSRALRARAKLRKSGLKVRLLSAEGGYTLSATYDGLPVDATSDRVEPLCIGSVLVDTSTPDGARLAEAMQKMMQETSLGYDIQG